MAGPSLKFLARLTFFSWNSSEMILTPIHISQKPSLTPLIYVESSLCPPEQRMNLSKCDTNALLFSGIFTFCFFPIDCAVPGRQHIKTSVHYTCFTNWFHRLLKELLLWDEELGEKKLSQKGVSIFQWLNMLYLFTQEMNRSLYCQILHTFKL